MTGTVQGMTHKRGGGAAQSTCLGAQKAPTHPSRASPRTWVRAACSRSSEALGLHKPPQLICKQLLLKEVVPDTQCA